MKNIFFAFILPMATSVLTAQKHDFLWMGGHGSPAFSNFFVSFNTFPPSVISIVGMNLHFDDTNLTMSDSFGDIIFVSDGCEIRNKEFEVMENGDTINAGEVHDIYCDAGYTLDQGIFSIPRNTTEYDVFHFRQDLNWVNNNSCTVKELLHSRIDMSLNQGLGKVVTKDEVLLTDCFQRACANRHANGRDWWILVSSNAADSSFIFTLMW